MQMIRCIIHTLINMFGIRVWFYQIPITYIKGPSNLLWGRPFFCFAADDIGNMGAFPSLWLPCVGHFWGSFKGLSVQVETALMRF